MTKDRLQYVTLLQKAYEMSTFQCRCKWKNFKCNPNRL